MPQTETAGVLVVASTLEDLTSQESFPPPTQFLDLSLDRDTRTSMSLLPVCFVKVVMHTDIYERKGSFQNSCLINSCENKRVIFLGKRPRYSVRF